MLSLRYILLVLSMLMINRSAMGAEFTRPILEEQRSIQEAFAPTGQLSRLPRELRQELKPFATSNQDVIRLVPPSIKENIASYLRLNAKAVDDMEPQEKLDLLLYIMNRNPGNISLVQELLRLPAFKNIANNRISMEEIRSVLWSGRSRSYPVLGLSKEALFEVDQGLSEFPGHQSLMKRRKALEEAVSQKD